MTIPRHLGKILPATAYPRLQLEPLLRIGRRQCVCLAGLFAGLVGAGQAQMAWTKNAADLSLEELVNIRVDVVFAASKYEQKVTQAPASVTIVTADEIQKFGYRTLADVLRSVRGFYVSNDRTYSFVGSQGFQRPGDFNTRYLFLIDGHRINDNIFDAGTVGNGGSVDLDLIDRVEVIRGPSSSIYGSNAFLGVINVITKTGHQIDGAEASVEGSSFGGYGGRFSFGKKFSSGVEWLASGSYSSSEGQKELYFPAFDQRISGDPRARLDGVARDADGEQARQFFTSLVYRDFTLSGLYSSRTKDVPTAPYGAFFGIPSVSMDQRWYIELKYDHQFDENTELSGRFSYDAFPHAGRFPYDYTGNNQPADVVYDYDRDFGNWLTTAVQLKRRFFNRHTLIAGMEYRNNLTQHLFNYDSQNTSFVEVRHNGGNMGAFGQVEAVLRPDLLLNGGLRFDHFDTFGSTLNPRLALIYNPRPQTTFKLLYGQAFRAPNAYELYYGSPALGQVPNPALEPEKIRTYEFIFEQYLPAHLRFSASAYSYEITDLISQTVQPVTNYLIFTDLERVQAKGVEFELEGKYAGGLLARVSYAAQRTEDAVTGDELTNSPRHLFKGNFSVPFYREKIFLSLELQYQSAVKLLSGLAEKDYLIGNVTLFSKAILPRLEISVSVYNFLDARYGTPGAGGDLQDIIPQDGRSFRLKTTYKF